MPTLKRFDEDAYRTECDATVVAVHPEGIELDQTVFYARSGGQAGDTGTLLLRDGQTVAIADTLYSPDRQTVLHVPADAADAALLSPGVPVTASIDWDRRHRLMRLHTCLHLLGSLIPVPVTGCGISPDSGRIDFDLPESTLDRDTLTTQLNALISRDTPVRIDLITPEELAAQPELVRTIGAAGWNSPTSRYTVHTSTAPCQSCFWYSSRPFRNRPSGSFGRSCSTRSTATIAASG